MGRMSHRYDEEYLDVYCCLPHEFIVIYPQPRSSQPMKKSEYQNRNALERISSSSSKYKPKNLLDPYKQSKDDYANDTHTFNRRRRIMSIDWSDHQLELTRSDRHDDDDKKSSVQSLLSVNRISSWRKLQANITASHYDSIQQFQCERQREQDRLLSISRPIMRSPLIKQQEIENSQRTNVISNIINSSISSTLLSINSSTNLTDSNSNHRNIQSKENEELLDNDSSTNLSKSSLDKIEEFQPIIEILSPAQVPSILLNDILSSFFPNISTSPANSNTISNITEHLLIDQSSTFIPDQQQPRKVHSLFESIEELCLLIRKLLQYELTEQKITSLQTTIANQLAILLTYLAMPNHEKIISDFKTVNSMDKMTSTEEENVLFQKPLVITIGTQTNLVEFKDHQSSSEKKQEATMDILPLLHKETSHTDLISTSVSLHLPGRRLNHALSDTFLYHIHHHQQYSSSYHQLISFSETTIHSLINRLSTKEKKLQYIGQKFQHYVELTSSNTWLEASTEFTPDFLLTTMNSSKYDDDDQTQQFGIDTEKQDYQTETISIIIDKNQPKIDTLTFNSTEKENYDSLELDIEQDNEEGETSISLINESNSLFFNDDRVYPGIYQLNKEKYFCQLIEPLLETYQWQMPILPRKSNSMDLIYEKRTAKIDFKYSKIRSNSNNGINLIGKQVRIKSNPSSRASTSTIPLHSSHEQSRKLSSLNFNNNCHQSESSIQSLQLSSTSCDSLCSFDSDTLDKEQLLPKNHPEFDGQARSKLPYLADVTDKLDSNIAIAQSLLNMLNSFDDNHSSTMKIDVLHMYIRQFLIEFDTRVRLARKKSRNINNKDTFPFN